MAVNVTGKSNSQASPMLVRDDGTSDYNVQVTINDVRIIWCGKIIGHVREQGAAALLRKIADEMDKA